MADPEDTPEGQAVFHFLLVHPSITLLKRFVPAPCSRAVRITSILRARLAPARCAGWQRQVPPGPHQGAWSQPLLATPSPSCGLGGNNCAKVPMARGSQLLLTQFNVYLEVDGRLDFKIN